MTDREIWKPVVGHEDTHEVSSLGRVRSRTRVVVRSNGAPQTIKGKLLSGRIRDGGYRVFYVGGREVRGHHLVLNAFVGSCPVGQEGCHDNGNPQDNALRNLRWGTRPSNIQDQLRHGTHTQAAKDRCPRGHLLSDLNIVTSAKLKGFRDCLSCNRARSWCYRRGIPLTQEIADRYYESIFS